MISRLARCTAAGTAVAAGMAIYVLTAGHKTLAAQAAAGHESTTGGRAHRVLGHSAGPVRRVLHGRLGRVLVLDGEARPGRSAPHAGPPDGGELPGPAPVAAPGHNDRDTDS